MDLEKAIATQVSNILAKTGKTVEQLSAELLATGIQKHAEKMVWVKSNWGLSNGDSNRIVLHLAKLNAPVDAEADPLDALYSGPKVHLRPIHDAIMAEITTWGDFEIHPKKGYVALRRKRQFAMLGPATNTRVELGLNVKSLVGGERLIVLPAGGMVPFKVNLTDPAQVDAELFGWLRTSFEASGA